MNGALSQLSAVVFALLAALCAAVGMVVRKRAIQDQSRRESSGDAVVTSWVSRPLWWAGTVVAFAGYAFQAVALSYGSLLLVQPLIVSSLLFVLPLGARFLRQHVRPSDWRWSVVLTASLTVFVLVGRPSDGVYEPSVWAWTIALTGAALIVVGGIVLATRVSGRMRAMLLAVSVAVLLGLVAVLTKVCTQRFAVGSWHSMLTVPAPYLLVALAVAVTILQQSAFNAGALQASVPIMLVGEPLVAVVIGMLVLDERLTAHGIAAPILLAMVGAMTAATIALGRGSCASTTGRTGMWPPQSLTSSVTTATRASLVTPCRE
jgi:drug/metabolite transporter (DMT)-like permease